MPDRLSSETANKMPHLPLAQKQSLYHKENTPCSQRGFSFRMGLCFAAAQEEVTGNNHACCFLEHTLTFRVAVCEISPPLPLSHLPDDFTEPFE